MALPNRKMMPFVEPLGRNIPSEFVEYIDWPQRATGFVPGVPSYIERVFGSEWDLGLGICCARPGASALNEPDREPMD
jgi:hypothetical protein